MNFDSMAELLTSFHPYLTCLIDNLGLEVPDMHDASALADWGWTALRQLVESGRCDDIETLADLYFFSCSLKKFRFGGDPVGRKDQAIRGFIERNARCTSIRPPIQILVKAKALLAKALPEPPACVKIDGRFGPGQVAEKYFQVKRWNTIWREYPDYVTDPFDLFSESARRHGAGPEAASRLCAVPKTHWKDRLITVEPVVNSYLQQWTRKLILLSVHMGPLAGSIMDQFQGECSLEDATGLRSTWYGEQGILLRDSLGIGARCARDYQRFEQYKTRSVCALRQAELAVRASGTGEFATLDLKDASDSIPWTVVMDIFPGWLIPYLERCRTPDFVTESGECRTLNMYGGMGNATTFIVETLYFWSIIAAIQEYMGNQWCGYRVDPLATTVFGDDIIVKTSVARTDKFRSLLAECGLILSDQKSCWSDGPGFREACGAVAINGRRLPEQIWTYGASGVGRQFAIADYLNRLIRTNGLRLLYAVDVIRNDTSIPVIKQQRYFYELPSCGIVIDPTWGLEEERYTQPESRWNSSLQTEEWRVRSLEIEEKAKIKADSITQGELKGVLSGYLRPVQKSRKHQYFVVPGDNVTVRDRWIIP